MNIRTSLSVCALALLTGGFGLAGGIPAAHAAGSEIAQHRHTAFGKLSLDAANAASNSTSGTVRVIVQFKTTDATAKLGSLSRVGAIARRHFTTSNAAAVEVPASTLEDLANDDNVSYVSLDRPVSSKGQSRAGLANAPSNPTPSGYTGPAVPIPVVTALPSIATSAEYTTDAINAPAVWNYGYYGTGIGIAVIDSGVQNVPDLNSPTGPGSRIVYSAAFPSNMAGGTADQYGHGTHVAGLIAGDGSKSFGKGYTRTFLGVAPNANIINLRVLDQNGQGTDSTVIQAIETAIQLKSTYNIRIINLSLGRPVWETYAQDPLCQAVEAAWKAGIVVVVAAGNDGRNQTMNPEGYGTINAPGNDPYVITVGAMNTMGTPAIADDVLGSYSSKGPSFGDNIAKPDVVAPGNLVTSLVASNGETLRASNPTFYTPTSFYESNGQPTQSSTDYMPLSGTSMATGVVSGAVALMLGANPSLTPDQVKALLMLSANRSSFPTSSSVTDPITGLSYVDNYDALSVGAGYLDANAAIQAVWHQTGNLPKGTAMSPVVSYNAATSTASLVPDASAMWTAGSNLLPANLYGPNAFVGGATVLWGNSTLAGASDPNAFTALWGATVLWGSGTPAAATVLWGRSAGAGDTNEAAGNTDSPSDSFSVNN